DVPAAILVAMPLQFDLRTIFLVAACTAALGSATFVALRPMHPHAAGVLSRHAWAMGTMSVALLLFAIRDAFLTSFAHLAPNLLACISIALCTDATLRTFGRRPPEGLLGLQLVVLAAVWIAVGEETEDQLARVLAFSGV